MDFGLKLFTQLHAWENRKILWEKQNKGGKSGCLTGHMLCLAVCAGSLDLHGKATSGLLGLRINTLVLMMAIRGCLELTSSLFLGLIALVLGKCEWKNLDIAKFPPHKSLLKCTLKMSSYASSPSLFLLQYPKVQSCQYFSLHLCAISPFKFIITKNPQAQEEISFTKISFTVQYDINVKVWWGCFTRFCKNLYISKSQSLS